MKTKTEIQGEAKNACPIAHYYVGHDPWVSGYVAAAGEDAMALVASGWKHGLAMDEDDLLQLDLTQNFWGPSRPLRARTAALDAARRTRSRSPDAVPIREART